MQGLDKIRHHRPARPTSLRQRLAHPLALLLALVMFGGVASAQSVDGSGNPYAVVTHGAHLLTLEPNADGYFEHIAYLPVGTIIERRDGSKEIKVDGWPMSFAEVVSQSGANGYIQEDLYQLIGDTKLAVPVAFVELPLFARPYSWPEIRDIIARRPDYQCDVRCITFSRSDGAYLEVIGKVDDYFEVALVRPKGDRDSKNWFLHDNLVDNFQVKIIDRESAALSMATWEQKIDFSTQIDPQIMEKILRQISDTAGIALDQKTIWCDLSIDAEGRVGIDAFFVSAGVSAQLATKKSGEFSQIGEYVWLQGDETRVYKLQRDIVCEESQPETSRRLVVQANDPAASDPKTYEVSLDLFTEESCHGDGGSGCSNWIFFNKEDQHYDKMVVVGDWNSYYAVMRQIEEKHGPIVPRKLANNSAEEQRRIIERQSLYDFILRQITVFKELELPTN